MIETPNFNGAFALDVHGLDALRLQAKQNPQQAAKGAAQQFEAMFLSALLKSMRDATPQDGPMDSEQTRMFTSMLDRQLAQTLSGKGMGLADVMLRQLTRNQAAAVAAPPAQPDASKARRGPAPATAARQPRSNVSDAPDASKALPAGATPATPARPFRPNAAKASGPQAAADFLSQMKVHALQASRASGVPARFLLGQAALESGWGRHEIRTADGSQSFNLFGIKAGRSWKGATVNVMTTEYVDGAPRRVMQKFRAYGSYTEAFQDYASLMRGNPRYAIVLAQTTSAGFAQGLQRAGYATDPQYADKLTRILNGAHMRQTLLA